MSTPLSVVIPVHNEAAHLPRTLAALAEAIARSDFDAEVIVVDDGSTDGSGSVVAERRDVPGTRVIVVPRGGRFKARRAGIEAAAAEWVLLLDARVRLHPDALRFLAGRVGTSASVWNGHVTVDTSGNPFGAFGNVLVHLAWRRYFDAPRETSYGLEDFDHYPKGTGCFFAPRRLLLDAQDAFEPRTSDWRIVSDDTQLIRWIAQRQRIHLSPAFGCDYQPRTSLLAFVHNALYRGGTFVDGHGRTESRFFPVVVGFYPVSTALALLAVRRPTALPLLVLASAAAGAAAAARARRPAFETVSFAALAPVYAVAHGAGMWRALGILARQRLRRIRKT
jgi:glycosyltransferase involved in cell wall biosynthesis